MTERELAAIEALLSETEAETRTCPKCGEDVTYWVSPCGEPGCPAAKSSDAA